MLKIAFQHPMIPVKVGNQGVAQPERKTELRMDQRGTMVFVLLSWSPFSFLLSSRYAFLSGFRTLIYPPPSTLHPPTHTYTPPPILGGFPFGWWFSPPPPFTLLLSDLKGNP